MPGSRFNDGNEISRYAREITLDRVPDEMLFITRTIVPGLLQKKERDRG
jgi:hypothetical protein